VAVWPILGVAATVDRGEPKIPRTVVDRCARLACVCCAHIARRARAKRNAGADAGASA
jgi:hypothetical protein